nr:hypothetical protein HK105_000613 [Polyrhizophydium stewartii]
MRQCPAGNADPLIRKAVRAVPDSLLVEVPAGQRGDEYRNSPYISDPEIQLRAVPTLFEWSKTGPLKKLVEAECADEDLLAKFLA